MSLARRAPRLDWRGQASFCEIAGVEMRCLINRKSVDRQTLTGNSKSIDNETRIAMEARMLAVQLQVCRDIGYVICDEARRRGLC